jgi:hypothetical protein
MLNCIDLADFVQSLFDEQRIAQKAAIILKAFLEAQSPRLSMIAEKVAKKADAAYKMIQRFLAECDPCPALLRLFQEEAAFVLGDVTEMPRPGARKTAYVGHIERWQNFGLLAVGLVDTLPWTHHPFSFCDLFFGDDWSGDHFAQPRAFSGLRQDQGIAWR